MQIRCLLTSSTHETRYRETESAIKSHPEMLLNDFFIAVAL